MTQTITQEAWLAELEELAAKSSDGDGMTAAEMAEASGRCVRTIRIMLGKAIAAGKWEMSGRKSYTAIDGRRTLVPCYRPIVNPLSTEGR